MAARGGRPYSATRAARFATLDELLTAVRDQCRVELGPADAEYTESFEAAFLTSDESLGQAHAFARTATQAARSYLGATSATPTFKTPLAKLVERHADEPSRKIALRALLAGYVPSLTKKPAELTPAVVIATTRKAVDAIRKVAKPATFPRNSS